MKPFNKIQKELVRLSEETHCEGIRHKGLSGAICEKILIKKLKNLIPKFNFNGGQIKYYGIKSKGPDIDAKEHLSPQLDVIIYKGKPIYEICGEVIVHIDQVLGIIEVKKWTYSKTLKHKSRLSENIKKIEKQLKEKSRRNIPLFFISFRFGDRKNKISWFSKIKNFPIKKHSYCFFGRYSVKNKRYLYPWEEGEIWDDFENKNPYRKQFERLIEDIKSLK